VPTLVLPPRYTVDSNLLWRAALEEEGWSVERLSGWRAPDGLAERDPVLYGEPLFVAGVAAELGLAVLEPSFSWLATTDERLVGRRVRAMTLAQGRSLGERLFIKPADDKCFRAAVYPAGTDLPGDDVLPGETPILVSDVVVWELEVRCFVLERRVVTSSLYARFGAFIEGPLSPEEHAGLAAFCDEVLARADLPPAVTLDVGVIAGHRWAVVELNAAWGSGVYACDPRAILPVLRRACLPRPALSPADARWVISRG
jgi:hypothetical protein